MMNSRTGSSARLDALDSFLTLVSDPGKMKAQVDQLRRETTAANEAKGKATAEIAKLGDLARQKLILDKRHEDLTQREAVVKQRTIDLDTRHRLVENLKRDNEVISGTIRQGVEEAEKKAKTLLVEAKGAIAIKWAEHEAKVRAAEVAAAKSKALLDTQRAEHEKAVKALQASVAKHQAEVQALEAAKAIHAKKVEQLRSLVTA